MNITKSQLQRLIKEEIQAVLNEQEGSNLFGPTGVFGSDTEDTKTLRQDRGIAPGSWQTKAMRKAYWDPEYTLSYGWDLGTLDAPIIMDSDTIMGPTEDVRRKFRTAHGRELQAGDKVYYLDKNDEYSTYVHGETMPTERPEHLGPIGSPHPYGLKLK